MFNEQNRWWWLVCANVMAWCVLGFYQGSNAAPQQNGQPPFANPIEQRNAMVQELQAINATLKEQLAILKSGKVHVVVDKP